MSVRKESAALSSWAVEEEDDEGRCEGRRDVLLLKREEHSVERERIRVEKAEMSAAEGSARATAEAEATDVMASMTMPLSWS